jgi:FKBP-type peptidyl-prolyl cis-trans isomerase
MLLDDYLQRANITVEPTHSGLYFIEMEKGNGSKPKPEQALVVHYTGYFIDGNIFSTTYYDGRPFEFKYGNGEVIQGWEEGISQMNVGGKYKLIIPSHLAYGSEGKGSRILPYSTLIFEIELLGIK